MGFGCIFTVLFHHAIRAGALRLTEVIVKPIVPLRPCDASLRKTPSVCRARIEKTSAASY